MRLRRLAHVAIALLAIIAAGYASFSLSPWPYVLFVRHAFDGDAARRNAALGKHLPQDVTELRDRRYGGDSDAYLDIYFPSRADAEGVSLPTVVWIHGGAFIAGGKSDVGNYLKILAGRGYTTVAVGYALAPGANYPVPVLQANEALSYLTRNAERLHVDPDRLFLAGDSAGAQIAAQLAAIVSDPAYSRAVGIRPAVSRDRLKGVVLFCGVYDASRVDTDGDFARLVRTAMWSYFGTRDFAGDPRLAQFSVSGHVTASFPPAFVSAGNADPLGPQSVAMADAIEAQGVAVERLFFPADHDPPLAHEYQFDLDQEAGAQALERLTAFLARLAG